MKKILILNTGGTMGMTPTSTAGLGYNADSLPKLLFELPHFHDKSVKNHDLTYVTPELDFGSRVTYDFKSLLPLLDSANMEMADWSRIAKAVWENYQAYDGFVVIHGTDTMAYTASALSFMFSNLAKPVILTGSQLPIFPVRSDATANLLGAILLASHLDGLHEVAVYFHEHLYRGNRVTKVDAFHLNAFGSPNFPPLAALGMSLRTHQSVNMPPKKSGSFAIQTDMESNVGVIRLFPGISASVFENFAQHPLKGLIIQSYGSGNAPTEKHELLHTIEKICARGVLVVNCTQCHRGRIEDLYATSGPLYKAGVVSGVDMTVEAALTKISYLLAAGMSLKDAKGQMGKSLRGELTESSEDMSILD